MLALGVLLSRVRQLLLLAAAAALLGLRRETVALVFPSGHFEAARRAAARHLDTGRWVVLVTLLLWLLLLLLLLLMLVQEEDEVEMMVVLMRGLWWGWLDSSLRWFTSCDTVQTCNTRGDRGGC